MNMDQYYYRHFLRHKRILKKALKKATRRIPSQQLIDITNRADMARIEHCMRMLIYYLDKIEEVKNSTDPKDP